MAAMLSYRALPRAERGSLALQPETAIGDLMDAGKAAYARGNFLAADAKWRAAIRAQVATLFSTIRCVLLIKSLRCRNRRAAIGAQVAPLFSLTLASLTTTESDHQLTMTESDDQHAAHCASDLCTNPSFP